MAPRRNKNPYLLPLAVTAATAAASFALYYFLSPPSSSSNARDTLGHESDVSIRSTRPAKATSQGTSTSTGSPLPSPDKPTILILTHESTTPSRLLAALPTPLPLDRVNIFIAIHSPETTEHPLSTPSDVGGSRGGRKTHLVYEQARGLYPPEVPLEVLLPFTNVESLVPLLKQLGPRTVYVEGELLGEEAEKTVGAVLDGGWVGGVVVAAGSPEVGRQVADETRRFGKRCVVCDVEVVGKDWNSRV